VALAAAAGIVSVMATHPVAALDRDRTIALHNIHTKETLTVQYKRSGKNVPEAMKQINWLLRDWRKNEPTDMDPALVDLLWEIHTELGSKEPIHIISGYRSRSTNEMLRNSVGGQASESRHILGKAADVHFPDVPLRQLRYSALIREKGGVGYYPTSGTPFVHLDTDAVRHWPRMPRHELALLFPNGSTRHQPADGGSITKEDVKEARIKNRQVATQVAEFFNVRANGRPERAVNAVVADVVGWEPVRAASVPKLLVEPRLVDRPSLTTAALAEQKKPDGAQFHLASATTDDGLPRAIAELIERGSEGPKLRRAALDLDTQIERDGPPSTSVSAWISAPAFDEEHPDELSYRAFPVAPMLSSSPSADDPELIELRHPDLERTLDLLDQPAMLVLFRQLPGYDTAQPMWAQRFRGQAINMAAFAVFAGEEQPGSAEPQAVRTAEKR